jgi:hypothetical protein
MTVIFQSDFFVGFGTRTWLGTVWLRFFFAHENAVFLWLSTCPHILKVSLYYLLWIFLWINSILFAWFKANNFDCLKSYRWCNDCQTEAGCVACKFQSSLGDCNCSQILQQEHCHQLGKASTWAGSGEQGFFILIFYFFLLLWQGRPIPVDNV